MTEPDLDDEGYPTELTLDALKFWPYLDSKGALDFMAAAWHWPDFVTSELSAAEREVLHADPDERFLRCATGGWSGNESLVAALESNRILHALTWRLSSVGGLHIYQYPKE